MITTTIAASAITPCGAPVADGRRRRTSRGTFGAGPASAKPSWNTTHVRRMTTADAGDDDQRTARLGDRHAGQRDAAEREREPDDLDERVGGRPADHPPIAGRRREGGEAVGAGVDRTGRDVAGHGELHHPAHPDEHPPGAEQPAVEEALAARRTNAERRLEHHHADDRERPETPRGQRERDEQTADEGEHGSLEPAPPRGGRHRSLRRRVSIGHATQAASSANTTMRSRVEPGG